jgi:hypothetical protein
VKKSSIKERDVQELLGAFDEDANNDEKQWKIRPLLTVVTWSQPKF